MIGILTAILALASFSAMSSYIVYALFKLTRE